MKRFLKNKFLIIVFLVMLFPVFYAAVTDSASTYNGYINIPLNTVSMVSGGLIQQQNNVSPAKITTWETTYPYLEAGWNIVSTTENTSSAMKLLYFGQHPFRTFYSDTAGVDLSDAVSPAKVTVMVPEDYNHRLPDKGRFRLTMGQNTGAVSAAAIVFDWELGVTSEGDAQDTTYTENTTVSADFSTDAGHQSVDFIVSGETIITGDKLDFRFWRVLDDNSAVAEIYNIAYIYPRKY